MEQDTMLATAGWIPLAEYCEKYDDVAANVHRRVADGIWERGVHYAAPTANTSYVYLPAALEWQKNRAAREAARAATAA